MLDNTSEADCVAYRRSKDDGLTGCILMGSRCQWERRDWPEGLNKRHKKRTYYVDSNMMSPPWRLLWCWKYATRDAEATRMVGRVSEAMLPLQEKT